MQHQPPPPTISRAQGKRALTTAPALSLLAYFLLVPLWALPLLGGSMAYGQEGPASDQIEEIVVTGSRIRINPFNSPAPLIGLSREDILDSGSVELSDILLHEPGIASDISTSNSQSSIQNAGVSSIEFRDIGTNRTLVLIDGRRVVSNSANSNRVSLSTVPSDFIRRTEVITGAASAIYGSDAIAGVVNIITENDFEGLEFNGRVGRMRHGGYEQESLRTTFGRRFMDDQAYFLVATSFYQQDELLARDRSRALLEFAHDYDCEDEDDIMDLAEDERLCINEWDSVVDGRAGDQPVSRYLGPDADLNIAEHLRDRSLNLPGGYFDRGNFWYDENGLNCELDDDGDCDSSFAADRDGYRYRLDNALSIPRDRFNVSTKFNWDLSDSLSWHNTLMFSRVETLSTRTPETFNQGEATPLVDPETGEGSNFVLGNIPRSNPFVPAAAANRSIRFNTRRPEVGYQMSERQTDTWRFATALLGSSEIWGRFWEWEASISHGRNELTNTRRNEINIVNLRQGLRAEADPDNPGSYRCSDEDARAAGCVPVNLFGLGSVTPEAADWIRAILRLESTVEQTSVMAYASTSELLQLPDGPMGMAFGFEWREDKQDNRNDTLSQFGGSTGPIVPNSKASIDVKELFAEISAPLLSGRPGAEVLTLTASTRLSDYSLDNVGRDVTSALGLVWRPVNPLMFRVRYGKAVRAPDLNEVFSPPRGDFDSFNDPCDGVGLMDEGVLAANCLSVPGIVAAINDPDSSYHDDGDTPMDTSDDTFDADPSGYSPNAGNRDLTAESADSLTAGIVLEPTDWLSLSLDYYDIQVEDAIDALTNESILNQCYNETEGFFNQQYGAAAAPANTNVRCLDVFRDSDGNLHTIIQRQQNLQELRVSGWDFTMRMDLPMDAIGLPGDWTLNSRINRIKRDEVRFVNTDGETERNTFVGQRNPTNAGYLRLTWRHDGWRIRWSTYYTGSLVDSFTRIANYREQIDLARESGLSPAQYPEEPLYLFFDHYIEHDLSFNYDTVYNNTDLRWYGGINNVFDKNTPLVPTGDPVLGASSNYDDPWGPPLGRQFYLGLELTFNTE